MKLAPMTESDVPQIHEWLSDPNLMYYLKTEQINFNLGVYSWCIYSLDSLIGWADLFNVDMDNKKAELGIAVPGHQPMVCYRAMIEVLRIGFMEIGLNRIYIRPLRSNLDEDESGKDQRERFGFVREGVERQSVRKGDIYEDVIVMSMLKDEFERRWYHACSNSVD